MSEDQSGRKRTLVGGWDAEPVSPLVPAPLESRPVPSAPEIPEEPRESGVVSVPIPATDPEPSAAPAPPPPASGDEKLPASQKSGVPTGTLLKPPGAETQAMQAVRFDEVQRDLNEKRAARRARIDNAVRWGKRFFAGLVFAAVVYYLVTR